MDIFTPLREHIAAMLLDANSRCRPAGLPLKRNNAIMERRGRNNKKGEKRRNGWFLSAYLVALAFR